MYATWKSWEVLTNHGTNSSFIQYTPLFIGTDYKEPPGMPQYMWLISSSTTDKKASYMYDTNKSQVNDYAWTDAYFGARPA